MFFVLSKTLDVLLDPLWWCVFFVGAGLLLRRGKRNGLGFVFMAGGIGLFGLASMPPVARELERWLEADLESTYSAEKHYDAVVLLGGVVNPAASSEQTLSYNDNVDRLLAVYEVLRTDHAQLAILSGGVISSRLKPESELLARQLQAWGIAPERMVTEVVSKNTHENAVETAKILSARHVGSVLLVTSAFHMERAAGAFRAAGVTFDTLPVDRHAVQDDEVHSWLPRAEVLASSSRAIRELAGRFIYARMGYSVARPN